MDIILEHFGSPSQWGNDRQAYLNGFLDRKLNYETRFTIHYDHYDPLIVSPEINTSF